MPAYVGDERLDGCLELHCCSDDFSYGNVSSGMNRNRSMVQ